MNYPDPENVPPVWQVGGVILDRYEVKQVFTGGGMGLVYRVHHRDWNMDLAGRSRARPSQRTEPQVFEDRGAGLRFPNIVRPIILSAVHHLHAGRSASPEP